MTLDLPRRTGRGRGLTAVIDFGPDSAGWTGIRGVEDLLAVAGGYIDFAKIYAMNALLVPGKPLSRIVAAYTEANVATFSGGILFEWAHRQGEVEALAPLLKGLGIRGLEISENYIRLDPADRDRWIGWFRDRDFDVIYEFGRKTPDEPLDLDRLGTIVGAVRAAGAHHVIVEQSEIDLVARSDAGILDRLARAPWFDDILIEADPLCFPAQHADLIRRFGANVSLANIAPGQALRLEGLRRGIGRGVDYAMFAEEDVPA
ncbi:phosphosulfolactate synthase [Cereibacter sphaeroides]|uniref:Phosphosulfolactate synthase n=1 Tax=Cereibacter sphaeroides TaxID=1063 RepID=A0AAX1UEZ5_CERSP|nr:phosphosulfolactate synthase [Cereibacter sphaeroides]RHZ90893.1 phosphosulfolactate synthase [Cereibacter sphaeroides]